MSKLERAINQLEQEIDQNKQAIYLQFAYTKAQLLNKLTSPSMLLLALTTGGLLSNPIKRQLKRRSKQLTSPRPKLSLVQKMITLSSEISVAVKLFNRFKKMAAGLVKKTDSNIMVTH